LNTINVSWNFTKYAAPPDIPVSHNSIFVVATGNDNIDFVRSEREFASEAVNSRRVIAVMNSDRNNGRSTCDTAFFGALWEEPYKDKAIVSYPGKLDGHAGVSCPGAGGGTSFSAPRVAWLAAAASPNIDPATWINAVSARIIQSRTRVADDIHAAPLDIKKLFTRE